MLKLIQILLLNLALTIGTSRAETTDNLITDTYEQFFDSFYEYPDIHMHIQYIPQDTYVYTGNPNYETTATAEHTINLDRLTYEITEVNYGYVYKSNSTGEGAIAIGLVNSDGDVFADAIHEFNITTINEWIDVDKVYNDMDNLSKAETILMGIGGVSDRGGTDDIMIGDVYLNYEYQEIPLDLITDIKLTGGIDDILNTEQLTIEPMPTHDIEIEAPTVAEAPTTETNTNEQKAETTQSTSNSEAKSETKETKTNEKTEVASESKGTERNTTRTETTADINSDGFDSSSIVFDVSGINLNDFVNIEMVETIQMLEMGFMEDMDFYEEEPLEENIALVERIADDGFKEIIFYDGRLDGSYH